MDQIKKNDINKNKWERHFCNLLQREIIEDGKEKEKTERKKTESRKGIGG